MQTDNSMKEYLKHIAAHVGIMVLILTIFFCICFFLGGCKSQQPLVQVRELVVHDTTQVVDSVYRDRVQYIYTKGDTVFKTDSVFLYKYKYIDKVQEVTVRDSVPYPVEVQVPVRVRNGYDKFTSWGFWLLFILILAFTAFKIAKWYFIRK